MKELPLAMQTALLESERKFTEILKALGLNKKELDQVAKRIRRDHPRLNSQIPATNSRRVTYA